MLKFVMIMMVRMFMSFVGITLVEDTEVFNCDEELMSATHEDHEMDDPIFEKIVELSDEEQFALSGYECSCGEEFYMFAYENEYYDFAMFADHNGQVLYYIMDYYD